MCATRFGGETVESVHWYLLPFLEWIVEQWDPMLHEERVPNRNAADNSLESLNRTREAPLSASEEKALAWEQTWHDWCARHCIDASRQGGLFPRVAFRRWRDRVEISWDTTDAAAYPAGFRFVDASGVARLPREIVASALYSTLCDAAAYLRDTCPDSERIVALCEGIERLKRPSERRFAWLFGLGASLPEMLESLARVRDGIHKLLADPACRTVLGDPDRDGLLLDPAPAALMFGSVAPDLDAKDRMELVRQLAEAMHGSGEDTDKGVDRLVTDEPVDEEGNAWRQGYEAAENLLEELGVRGAKAEAVDVEAILASLGVTVRNVSIEDKSIRAVAIGGRRFYPTVLLNQNHRTYGYPTGKRFTLAHELCHLLCDRSHAREVALPSGPWAPRCVEQRANAFAAMLLMPPDRLRRAIANSSAPAGSCDLILDVSRTLKASFTAVARHMCNLGMLSEDERNNLLEEALDRDRDLAN